MELILLLLYFDSGEVGCGLVELYWHCVVAGYWVGSFVV